MDPEILLRVSSDNRLHPSIHLPGESKDFFFLALKSPGPDGIGDDAFEVVTVLLSTAGDDHDGPLVKNRKERRGGGRPGFPPEEVDRDSLAAALIREQPDRLSLLKGPFKQKEGIFLRDDNLPAVSPFAVKEPLEIGIAQGPGHDDERNAYDGTDVREKFPVADMGRDKDAASGFFVKLLGLPEKGLQRLRVPPEGLPRIIRHEEAVKLDDLETGEEKGPAALPGNGPDLFVWLFFSQGVTEVFEGQFAATGKEEIENVSQKIAEEMEALKRDEMNHRKERGNGAVFQKLDNLSLLRLFG